MPRPVAFLTLESRDQYAAAVVEKSGRIPNLPKKL